MGQKTSKTTRHERDIRIQRCMNQYEYQDMIQSKVLVMGSANSGKSTICKQAQLLFESEFSSQHQRQYISIITRNVLEGILMLIQCDISNLDEIRSSVEYLSEIGKILESIEYLDEQTAQHVAIVWNHPEIQHAFAHNTELPVLDSVEYFCEKLQELQRSDYIPSNEDILHAKSKTIGVQETFIELRRTKLRFIDIGEEIQRNYKLMHHFDSCDFVLFVVDASDFSKDGLAKSLDLFEEICNSQCFQNKDILLFLNKKDLLKQKLQRGQDPSVCFGEEYTGGWNYEAAVHFLVIEFSKRSSQRTRTVYTHLTCALDCRSTEYLLQDVIDITLCKAIFEVL